MPRSSARILSTIWADPEWKSLSAGAQRLYLLALSQPNLSLCGVVSYTANRWSGLASDTSVRSVRAAVKELTTKRYFVVDESTEELWIRSFVKHDGVLDHPNARKGMIRDFGHIHSQGIRQGFLEGLPEGIAQELGDPSCVRARSLPLSLPESISSSTEDDEGSLRSEAEKRLRERKGPVVIDREAWIAKCMENIRTEREADLRVHFASAASFGRNLARSGMEEAEIREKVEAEYGGDHGATNAAMLAAWEHLGASA